LARNLNVGSFSDIDCGRMRFNPTSNPRLFCNAKQNREHTPPGPVP
jgi:hypothetical protein